MYCWSVIVVLSIVKCSRCIGGMKVICEYCESVVDMYGVLKRY